MKNLAGAAGSRCKGQRKGHWSERAGNCASCVSRLKWNAWKGSVRLALVKSDYINQVVCCSTENERSRGSRSENTQTTWNRAAAQTVRACLYADANTSVITACVHVRWFVLMHLKIQQALPTEALSACSCSLLNKAWTLTFGVQLPNQNRAPMDWTFCQKTKKTKIVPNPQLGTTKLICKWAEMCEL